jgi:hypothetical protein
MNGSEVARHHQQACAATQPRSARFELVGTLEGLQTLVSHVHLSVLPAGPGASDGADPYRRCRGCCPPFPASPESGCPQLHQPAATSGPRCPFTTARSNSASWRSISRCHSRPGAQPEEPGPAPARLMRAAPDQPFLAHHAQHPLVVHRPAQPAPNPGGHDPLAVGRVLLGDLDDRRTGRQGTICSFCWTVHVRYFLVSLNVVLLRVERPILRGLGSDLCLGLRASAPIESGQPLYRVTVNALPGSGPTPHRDALLSAPHHVKRLP